MNIPHSFWKRCLKMKAMPKYNWKYNWPKPRAKGSPTGEIGPPRDQSPGVRGELLGNPSRNNPLKEGLLFVYPNTKRSPSKAPAATERLSMRRRPLYYFAVGPGPDGSSVGFGRVRLSHFFSNSTVPSSEWNPCFADSGVDVELPPNMCL